MDDEVTMSRALHLVKLGDRVTASSRSRLVERATVLYQLAFNEPGRREMAKFRRPIWRGTHLTPITPSR